jgi:hypothetical protein
MPRYDVELHTETPDGTPEISHRQVTAEGAIHALDKAEDDATAAGLTVRSATALPLTD